MSPRCVRVMGVCRALALFGDAKQVMGEEESGPVETGLTGPVATALPSRVTSTDESLGAKGAEDRTKKITLSKCRLRQ